MDDYSIPEIQLTEESFRNSDWQSVITACPEKDCWRYAIQFASLTESNRLNRDHEKLLVHLLLHDLCCLPLSFDDRNYPFTKNGHDGFQLISDISQDYIDSLSAWVVEIDDAELQSRIADIVWIRMRDRRIAEIAVDSYLKSSEHLAKVQSPSFVASRIERAIQIAISLGKRGVLYEECKKRVENLVDQWVSTGQQPCTKILLIFRDHNIGDPLKLAELCLSLASSFSSSPQWEIHRKYLDLARKFYAKAKIDDKEKAVRRSYAESYLTEIEELESYPEINHSLIVDLLKKAKEAFTRRNLFLPEEIEYQQFSKRIISHQKLAASEIHSHYLELPTIGESIEKAVELVKGKSFYDAIFSMTTLLNPTSLKELNRLFQTSRNGLFSIAPSKSLFNRQGRIIGHSPLIPSDNPREREIAEKNELLQLLNFEQWLTVDMYLSPAIQQINSEHLVRLEDWMPILIDNPAVPAGREVIYAMGLQAGLNGNWIESVHLLVPQLENSIRYLLENHGVITFRWGTDNEDDFPLSKILYKEEVKSVFGEDLTFHLKCLLLERFGSNLRNVVAHGLADVDFLISWRSIYLWWICLYILCSHRIS